MGHGDYHPEPTTDPHLSINQGEFSFGPADTDLARRAANGDRLAFQALYLRHRPALLSFICGRYPSLDELAAEDVVSEVVLRVWQHHSKLDSVNNLWAYLKTVGKNVVARRFRARRSAETELSPGAVSPALSPTAALERDELAHQINQAIALLVRSRRLALELSQDGLSAKQIASHIGCTENAARRRLQKAKEDLARLLSRCGDSCAVENQRPEQCPARKEKLYCLKSLFHRELQATS